MVEIKNTYSLNLKAIPIKIYKTNFAVHIHNDVEIGAGNERVNILADHISQNCCAYSKERSMDCQSHNYAGFL